MSPRPRKSQRNLPPCVYFQHGAYWYVKKSKWTRLGSDLAQALSEYASLHIEPSGGMANLIDRALASIKKRKNPPKANTLRQYKSVGKRLKKAFVEFSPEQVKPKHIAAFKASMAAHPNMGNRCLTFLRLAFAYAVELQEIESNPCIGIARNTEAKRDRYITDEEFWAIRDKADPQLQIIMDLCYLTAQRISDVLAIRRADLSADGILFKQGKTGTRLTVKSSPDLRAVIERANSLRGNLTALTLLYNNEGKPPAYRTVHRAWDEACAAAGVDDAHLHDIRAKSITDAKNQGHDPTALAGHASPQMTKRYIRLRESPVVVGPRFIRQRG